MLLNETSVVDLNSSKPVEGKERYQWLSPNWGVWGKERYSQTQTYIEDLHQKQKELLLSQYKNTSIRLQQALNFSYGLCDLKGNSAPISELEFNMLSEIYASAVAYSVVASHKDERSLIQELYCIRKTAEQIPDFSEGKVVNEGNTPELHRQYVYLDFFKFSLINILIRIEAAEIAEFSSASLASNLVLAWFTGSGSFLEKASLFFHADVFGNIQQQCQQIIELIEEAPELPRYDYSVYQNSLQDLIQLIDRERLSFHSNKIAQKHFTNRMHDLHACNQYYAGYFETQSLPISEKPLGEMYALLIATRSNSIPDLQKAKADLRRLRLSLDKKYELDIPRYQSPLLMRDFFDLTTHPYFRGLQYEGEMLGIFYTLEFPTESRKDHIAALFKEIVPFYTCKIWKGKLLPDDFNQTEDLPRLVVAHHVHNANCDKLNDMMTINRLIQWPLHKQVLNISSSSSNPDIVKREREICRVQGFNHFRIHARQHLKAGNQNRSISNALNGKGREYYLTLDDDYFIFPTFPQLGHQILTEQNCDYYQAPLAFKGVYKTTVTYGEKTDAEIMHYFESTSGDNELRTYVFPRGTGTIFAFENGVSSVSDTGGFLVNHSSEDFGQGFLSLLQEYGLKGKKKHTKNPGIMSDQVLCVGEGVDLTGKLMQMIRWCHGSSQLYLHLLIPALFAGLFKGKFDIFLNRQVQRLTAFMPMAITAKLLTIIVFCLPFLNYVLRLWGIKNLDHLNYANVFLVTSNILLFAAFLIHYLIVQKRFSYSPIRLMLMDILTATSSAYGYVLGLLGVQPKWWSNKSRKIKWKTYSGPFALFLLNIIIVPFAFYSHFNLSAYWALVNAVILLSGFLYLSAKQRHQESYRAIPPNLLRPLFKVLIFASVGGFIAYTVIMINRIENVMQAILFSIILLQIINLIFSSCIALIYIIKDEQKEKNKIKAI